MFLRHEEILLEVAREPLDGFYTMRILSIGNKDRTGKNAALAQQYTM
jgi:hypothetical protein